MGKAKHPKTTSSHPAETTPAEHSHGHADDAHGGGHHGPVETEEQRADLAHAQRVEDRWASALRKPGALIALVAGSLSLAWLASLGRTAPALSWTTLFVLVLAFAWGLALARGERIEQGEPAAPQGGSPAPQGGDGHH